MLLEDSLYLSTFSESFQPRILTLPIIDDDIDTFTIKSICRQQTQNTLKHILLIQKRFPLGVIPKILSFILVGILFIYFAMVLIVFSLFNLVVFFIFIVLFLRYISWSIRLVDKHRKKYVRKLIQLLLQKENKRFYSKKLIKWELDESQLVIHNLRLMN